MPAFAFEIILKACVLYLFLPFGTNFTDIFFFRGSSDHSWSGFWIQPFNSHTGQRNGGLPIQILPLTTQANHCSSRGSNSVPYQKITGVRVSNHYTGRLRADKKSCKSSLSTITIRRKDQSVVRIQLTANPLHASNLSCIWLQTIITQVNLFSPK